MAHLTSLRFHSSPASTPSATTKPQPCEGEGGVADPGAAPTLTVLDLAGERQRLHSTPALGPLCMSPRATSKDLSNQTFSSVKVPFPTLFYKVSTARALVDVWLLLLTSEKGSAHGPPGSHGRHSFSPQSRDQVHFINHITNCKWN